VELDPANLLLLVMLLMGPPFLILLGFGLGLVVAGLD
jgi:hypothetical protein